MLNRSPGLLSSVSCTNLNDFTSSHFLLPNQLSIPCKESLTVGLVKWFVYIFQTSIMTDFSSSSFIFGGVLFLILRFYRFSFHLLITDPDFST